MRDYNYKKWLRVLMIMVFDILSIAACGGIALLVRFEFSFEGIPGEYKASMLAFIGLQCVITIAVFMIRKMYHYVWRSVSAYDVADMVLSVAMAYLLSAAACWVVGIRVPSSVGFINLLCQLMALVGMRCFFRFYAILSHVFGWTSKDGERIMLIGAGEAGRILLHEIRTTNKLKGRVCCIVDDNPAKWGKRMDGVPISGGCEQIETLVERKNITQIIFAIPSASAAVKKRILEQCQKTGCKVQTLPGIYQLVNGDVSLSDVKDVQVEDLLGRDPVQLDTHVINRFLRNQVVLVTGGGGSIGGELCRQIAGYHPKQLIILDIYVNNAYELQQELRRNFPQLNLKLEIASIRDKERIYRLFDTYRPDVVFHAAAHKHVPLMEDNPEEAVKNNIFGTYHIARAAEKYGVKKVVMISTDKAVNPTNFMGATKRFCEMIMQSRQGSGTEFCAVRFGNVLGSNGSVVPLFKWQIEHGGPVTITDKRIIRYFMLIPEAAQLVLEAGAIARSGQIFVLDMGEPVKILDLAENLIRLSGLEPYKDIEIKEIGLRPGEKLFEELLTEGRNLGKTANEKIFVEQQETISHAQIMDGLTKLDELISQSHSKESLFALMKELVPTYYDPDEVNLSAAAKKEELIV